MPQQIHACVRFTLRGNLSGAAAEGLQRSFDLCDDLPDTYHIGDVYTHFFDALANLLSSRYTFRGGQRVGTFADYDIEVTVLRPI